MPSSDDFETCLDTLSEKLDKIELEFSREIGIEDEGEVKSVIFDFYSGIETDYYLGARIDQPYVELVWQFNLVPYVASQINQEQANKVINELEIEYEIDEIGESQTRKLGIIKEQIEEKGVEKAIQETNIDEMVDDDLDKADIERVPEHFNLRYAAILSLDSVSNKKTAEIQLRLEEICSIHPVEYDLDLSENNGVQGFTLRYPLFPKVYGHEGISSQKLNDAYRKIANFGEYAENFLKYTFNLDDEPRQLEEGDNPDPMFWGGSGGPINPDPPS